jgi:GntR family transcriptional repressor for pyruvate dehydrogenase complex
MGKRSEENKIIISRIEKAHDIPNLVVDQIVNLISSGVLKAGDKLPSELEMTRRFGISRISLREAMKLLEAKGYIESQGRKGKYVKSVLDNALRSPIKGMISVDHKKIWELLAVKRIIDSEAASMAARRATDKQLRTLMKFKENMDNIDIDEMTYNEGAGRLYADFYTELADATNNTIISHLMKSIANILSDILPSSKQRLQGVKDSSRRIYEKHINIPRAIEEKNPDKAKKAMIEYIDYLEGTLKAILK